MNNTIQIPIEEYEAMREEITLLKDNALLSKVNRLVEILFQEKYGLYMGDYTKDLTEDSIQKNWPSVNSKWDNV